MVSRLARWLDRLILSDFEIQHKLGSKIGLADYLTRKSNGAAVLVSAYDSIFSVAKIRLKCSALGYDQKNSAVGPVFTKHQKLLTKTHALCKSLSNNSPIEGVVS